MRATITGDLGTGQVTYSPPDVFPSSQSSQRRGGCAERSEGADGVVRTAKVWPN